MRFSKYILIPFFVGCTVLSHAQQTDTSALFSLQKCLDIAIKNNLQVKQGFTNAELSRIDLRQSRENLLPSISGGASRTFNQGRAVSPITNAYVNQSQTNDSYSVGGNMTIFNGFALQNAIKAASYSYQAGKMDFQAAKDVVTINVITGYLAILDFEEILAADKSQLAVQQETLDRLTILDKQGANKAASDLTDQQGQLAGNKVNVVNAQNSLDAAKLSLFQQMNIPYDPKASFQALNAEELKGQYGSDPEQIYQAALQQFAAVKSATFRRESAEKNVKSLRGALLPSVTLGAGLSTAYTNSAQKQVTIDTQTVLQNVPYGEQFKNNYTSAIVLGLNVPIFTNGVRRNNLAKAKINALYSRDLEEYAKIQLRQNVEQAYYNMAAAYQKYQVIAEQVKAYTESYRIYKIRFDAGVLTSVELIIAKNNMDAATVNLISARYDYFIDSKILDYYQGKLTF